MILKEQQNIQIYKEQLSKHLETKQLKEKYGIIDYGADMMDYLTRFGVKFTTVGDDPDLYEYRKMIKERV